MAHPNTVETAENPSGSVTTSGKNVYIRRIAGVETEYGITCVAEGGSRKLGPDEIARYMFRPVVDRWSSSNIFLPNASRLYLDVGSHPEIATAECDSISQLIAYDRAGDLIVNELAQQAELSLKAEGVDAKVYLLKNNLDSVGNSYGCHENYLVGREAVLKTLGKTLLPFLITRQLIAGAGCIKDGAFHISQRAEHVWEGVSSATTRSRPIINTRDEPHADSHKYRRLHVIVGDSNMAEPTCALKVGSAMLMLEMIEAGFDIPHIELENEINAIRDCAKDISGHTLIALKNQEPMTALAIQRAYFNAAREWLKVRESFRAADPQAAGGTSDEEMHKVLDLWDRTLQAIETQDFSGVDSEIDWMIKLKLLRTYQARLGLDPEDFSHPKLAHVDLTYHDIRLGRGIAPVLEHKGLIKRWVTDEAIAHARDHAPATTRAALRGKFLEKATALGAAFSADWLRLKVNRPEPHMVELGCPFSTVDARVDTLIEYMETHAQTDD
ncbi:Pup--protein ligase [Corynebacterium felinum]|uniref:Pup--protein ligase n=1 Tax=Corynebacterium felinum TaxID=131318 RepID=A0ABU2BE45_9CORY|nr:proteasome accessory factor A [Corynebacterium felinum]WJY95005.1 Pup--protein ligase [Corynebacterium felinum]